MPKPTASLSLDLDNLWSYMKVRNLPQWRKFPTYLPVLAPLVLDWLQQRSQPITFFVVGQDAALSANHAALTQIASAGHEIANHSFNHEPWMQNYNEDEVYVELARADEAIGWATGKRTVGFRGPGFCNSPAINRALKRLGYEYDASLLPSVLGPLARLYYLWGAKMSREDRQTRGDLFGKMSDGFRPLKAFAWTTDFGQILEIPVSTMPVFRVPFHLSYLLWLSGFSKALALRYLDSALLLCRLRNVEPSFLLHPLDFLGAEDAPQLAFFPGMQLPRAHKLDMASRFLAAYQKHFDVVPMGEHARRILARGMVRSIPSIAPATAIKPTEGATARKP